MKTVWTNYGASVHSVDEGMISGWFLRRRDVKGISMLQRAAAMTAPLLTPTIYLQRNTPTASVCLYHICLFAFFSEICKYPKCQDNSYGRDDGNQTIGIDQSKRRNDSKCKYGAE